MKLFHRVLKRLAFRLLFPTYQDPAKAKPVPGHDVYVLDLDQHTKFVHVAQYSADHGNYESNGGWFEPSEIEYWCYVPSIENEGKRSIATALQMFDDTTKGKRPKQGYYVELPDGFKFYSPRVNNVHHRLAIKIYSYVSNKWLKHTEENAAELAPWPTPAHKSMDALVKLGYLTINRNEYRLEQRYRVVKRKTK